MNILQTQQLAFFTGCLLQGLVLGSLLTFAILELVVVGGNIQLFRYQGF